MLAELISIGSELTSGQNLDTNSQWLSRRLAEMGIAVGWHTTIADDLGLNVEAFQIAVRRAKLVLATGGLGPTQDDLTREALAQVAGVPLEVHADSVARIQAMFAKRNREMPPRNKVQALFPQGAEPIANDYGTAPGIWMSLGDCLFIAMPGVPSEMYAMFRERVEPRLRQLGFGRGILVQRKINCFGAGESAVEQKLLDLTRRGHVPEVGITVSDATISLRILARAASLQEAQNQIEPIEATIRERLGELVFGMEDEELHDVVVRLLKEKRLTVALAEGMTAGQISQKLALVPGASSVLRGGIVAYDNKTKCDLLHLPESLLEHHGAASAAVAEAMAISCRQRFATDLALSTVGIAGPGGATPEKPVGLTFVGLSWEGGVRSHSFHWMGTRAEVQSRATKMALNALRIHLSHR